MRNGRHSWRPLTLAVCKGQTDVVRKLMESDGTDPNGIRHTDYGRPLLLDCESKTYEISRLLLNSGATVAFRLFVVFFPFFGLLALVYDHLHS